METRPHPDFPEPQIERISMRTMLASILSILNLERGIFYTSWEMIKSPGDAMRRFLFQDRSKFIDPLKFLVLTIPLYLFLSLNVFPESSFFDGIREGLTRANPEEVKTEAQEKLTVLVDYLIRYSDLLLLLTVPISAFWTRVILRSYNLNYGEHLVINSFLYGFMTLASIVFLPVHWISYTFGGFLMIGLSLVYQTYFIRSLFRKGWFKSLLYSLLLLALSLLTSMIGLIVIMVILVRLTIK